VQPASHYDSLIACVKQQQLCKHTTMKIQNLIMLFIALAAGLAAVYLTKNYIESEVSDYKAGIDAQYKPVKIVVAARPLQRGEVLNSDVLLIRPMPATFVHDEAIRPSEVDIALGHRLVHSINKGEALLSTHIAYSKGDTFSNLIADGKRAISFPVDVLSSVTGMMAPGDVIDLLLTINDGDQEKTFPILSNVAIIATGTQVDELGVNRDTERAGGRFQTITLHVTPDEAAKVTHALAEGDITVLLRSRSDSSKLTMGTVTKNTLLGKKKTTAKPKRRGPQIIRAGSK